jgi:anti-sigma-K factor RskA
MSKHSLPDPPGHEEFAELAAGWALHALEPDDESRFSAHLLGCAHCQRAVEAYEGALAELSFLAPAVEPPPRLGDRIRSEVARDVRATPPDPTGYRPVSELRPSSRRSTVGRGARVLAAAAAVIAVALGAANVVQYQRAEQIRDQAAAELEAEQREVSRRAELIRRMTQPGVEVTTLTQAGGGPVMGYVMVHDRTVDVLTDGMPRNDPDTEYVLWRVGREGTPTAMGKFDVGDDIDLAGAGRLPSGARAIDAYAVSLELRQDGLPASPTKVVADGKAAN